ncbi:MAG: magnesium transporter [Gemmatimonadetes bacterium]|nr:magnesium transporter [Gemmatimonadota bacterium]
MMRSGTADRQRLRQEAIDALNLRFVKDHPFDAAHELERLAPSTTAPVLTRVPPEALRPIWGYITPVAGDALLHALPDTAAAALLRELEPSRAAGALLRMDATTRERHLEGVGHEAADDFRRLMTYPADSAGSLMDAHVAALRADTTAGVALEQLRAAHTRGFRSVFLVDDDQHPFASVEIQELALADPERRLGEMGRPINAAVSAIDPRDSIVELLQDRHLDELPVLDVHGRLIGVVRARDVIRAAREASSVDLQMMVGVGKEEKALSPVNFAVRKRLLWMTINLGTAFLAASVVGIFESTIAQFTALAVLLPVVAGQSGNAGAQALAVTMRGLSLHEIGVRQWPRVLMKEFGVGILNGIAISITTAAGVYMWSGSQGLALVISLAMVLSMTIACMAGALVPIVLTRLGQDPAQSSSILLTTVTDVAGFMSFLGIATLLSGLLTP